MHATNMNSSPAIIVVCFMCDLDSKMRWDETCFNNYLFLYAFNSFKEILSVKHENVLTTPLKKSQRHQKRHSPLEFHREV
ncbi:hypothetical protein I3842_16G087200 [Carya illinoinensis]|uniref:Uncharacterized protein n=1 Tax=Carya illinoinensis TaxID=32201 RepID=A0A922D547_CARIL|nr:hypothetical protein I3842_16G087200 [Carya illinoinensis]